MSRYSIKYIINADGSESVGEYITDETELSRFVQGMKSEYGADIRFKIAKEADE